MREPTTRVVRLRFGQGQFRSHFQRGLRRVVRVGGLSLYPVSWKLLGLAPNLDLDWPSPIAVSVRATFRETDLAALMLLGLGEITPWEDREEARDG
jgi:hypothetical protein